MPKVSPLQSNFGGGEWSPLTYGRVDADRYKTGLKTCLNYIPTLQGALTRRPGTKFVAATKAPTELARLVPFEFSVTQAYILEFSNLACRFYKDNAIITNTAVAVTNATPSNPVQIRAPGHTLTDGLKVHISGVGGMGQINNREFTVANPVGELFDLLGIDGTGFDAYTSGGSVAEIYAIVTPYAETHLFDLRHVQSADVLYIVHPSYAPRKLSRTGHTAWTLSAINFLDGPYLSINATTTTLTPSAFAPGAGVTLTASAVTGINNDTGFQTTDVGRLIRIKEGSAWGYVKITGRTSTTVVTVTVVNTLVNSNAKATWRMGLWSDTTGYPAVVTFHEDRLCFAGAPAAPQRVDGSKSGDYENFAPSGTDGVVADSNAISFALNANDVNLVRWMVSAEKGLQIGTVAAEWVMRPATTGEALSPTNVVAKRVTIYGSAQVEPAQSGESTLFVQTRARKLMELGYAFEKDGYQAPDLTVLSEHLTATGLKQVVRQAEPQPVIWSTRNDGKLLGLTFERSLDSLKVGWAPHTIGGVSDAAGSPALVESIAVIPSADGTRDELWMVVQRRVDGAEVRYVEYMTKIFEDTDAQEDAFYVDSGLTYDSTPATVISGLHHIEGETVAVWADGAVQNNKTVENAKITLDVAASVVQIGLVYKSDGQMLRVEAGAADGTALGKTRRTHRVGMLLHRTLGLEVGFAFDNLETHNFREFSDPMDTAIPLFSGIISKTVEANYDFENEFCWRQSRPTPGTFLAVAPQMVTQDRG